jgi:type 1 glutamine amidotransferase
MGHEPDKVAALFQKALVGNGFEVEVSDTLDAFLDVEKLKRLNLIVPIWTMGTIKREQLGPLCEAVRSGVGIGGCHGGMCDSFRNETEYQFMTGGQWVAHPGNDGVKYKVNITALGKTHPITKGIPDFEVASEQYYMHVDPANKVLATTRFPTPGADGPHVGNGEFDMPVVWTKFYGKGKVFYCSLGHVANIVAMPPVTEICSRGFVWAAAV